MAASRKVNKPLVLAADETQYAGTPRENLARFVEEGRRSPSLGANSFDAHFFSGVGVSGGGPGHKKLWFGVACSDERPFSPEIRDPMSEPVRSAAKAMVLMANDADGTRSYGRYVEYVRAFQLLHDVLAPKGHDLSRVDTADFYAAYDLWFARGNTSIPGTSTALKVVGEIINEYRLSVFKIDFSVERPKARRGDAKEQAGHLPSATGLRALEAMTQCIDEVEPSIRLLLLIAVLLRIAPWRLAEVIYLPSDCELFEDVDGRPLSEDEFDARPEGRRYRLRYLDSKTRQFDVKDIPAEAVALTRAVMRAVRSITADARKAAAFISATGKPFLPRKYRNKDRLSFDDVETILGRSVWAVRNWLGRAGTGLATRCRKYLQDWSVDRQLVEAALMRGHRELPRGAPIPLHECLFVVSKGFLRDLGRARPAVCRLLSVGHIHRFLARQGSQSHDIFTRLKISEPDGAAVRVTPTMLRKLAITLALEAGVPPEQVSRWAGHADLQSLEAYDRRPAEDIVETARAASALVPRYRLSPDGAVRQA